MTDLQAGYPSTRQIQNLIKEKTPVEVKLSFGESLSGKIRWQDPYCIGLVDDRDAVTQIRFSAIAYIVLQS